MGQDRIEKLEACLCHLHEAFRQLLAVVDSVTPKQGDARYVLELSRESYNKSSDDLEEWMNREDTTP